MKLNQITIPSLDVPKATEFYKKLGLILIVDALPRYVRFELPDGDATFSIHEVDKLPKGEGIAIYFQNENLDKVVEELQQKSFQFDLLPTDQPWLWREARLKDLDGNQLILYKAGENRKNPPWRVI
ncbi:glyoxalase/bleomycin resistance protein/dioxygenase superfamily protein [Lutibacter sp. Hel_I_33_5]|uniref:VOC family protein n=1 Tax=Lutibacter sp. Hel_I_33_5 TaxID=1566289 RepID=UPI00119DB506|nr:VOC family protein [Lutibacter sp. Hel_I_33_5]TVZ57127.1 glyoxalase/bleomycin resistance protein/dioxygenase superfamily protein [Lutibacter sp. Hel_I_33_5]